MPDREKIIKVIDNCINIGECINCEYKINVACKNHVLSDVLVLLKEQGEKDEKILTALDGYRMCDEMSKNAYENLTKLIRSERGEVK